MAKMNIFAAVSNTVLAAIKQSRILIAESALGVFIVLILKNVADTLGVSEDISKLFGKGINDHAQAADLVAKSVAAAKTDSSVVGDLLQITTGKALSDQAALSDAQIKTVGKGILDGLNTSEVTSFSIAKSLSNTVLVTDDVGGEATIDDNQTITFFKVLNNLATASDAVSIEAAYNRQFNDSSNTSDAVSLLASYSRSFNDSVSITDQIILEVILPFSLSDSALASDSLQSTAGYNRAFDDGVDGLDVQVFNVGSGPVDSGSVGDQAELVASFNRSFESSVIATDDIGGEATIDDNQTIQFFKQLTNLSYATDSAVRFAGKVLNDILTAADSGTLLNQDYVDNPFYFAEDYVGVKRTF